MNPNEIVNLADFARDFPDYTITGKKFDGVTFMGPGVVHLDRCAFQSVTVTGHVDVGIDSVMWELARIPDVIVGVIPMVSCSLTDCRFEGLGFMFTTTADARAFRQAFGPPS